MPRKPKRNPLRKIRNDLIKKILNLEADYDRNYLPSRLEYAQQEVIDPLLNYLKALEYHYRDDVARGPGNRSKEYRDAMRLFKKVAAPIDPKESYTKYTLKKAPPKDE